MDDVIQEARTLKGLQDTFQHWKHSAGKLAWMLIKENKNGHIFYQELNNSIEKQIQTRAIRDYVKLQILEHSMKSFVGNNVQERDLGGMEGNIPLAE